MLGKRGSDGLSVKPSAFPGGRMRSGTILIVAISLAGSGCTRVESGADRPRPHQEPGRGRFESVACDLPRRELLRIWNGYHPGRSGDIQIVPREPNILGRSLTHSGPWDYLQLAPMLWYGPGHVPAVGVVRRQVTMADVAPTIGSLIGFTFRAPDGRPLPEVTSERDRGAPPKLIVVVVWDGGGRNVLAQHPRAWPNVRRLIGKGVWFEHFTVASSPSVTPATHTTLGTGAYPRRHGVIDLRFRLGGKMTTSFQHGPGDVLVPSLADVYDRKKNNRPEVGVVAFWGWHLGMMGHGSYLEGGDRDLAALLDFKTARWALKGPNAKYYEFPPYANDLPGLHEAIVRADASDGARDRTWLGERVFDDPWTLSMTPAFAEWQTLLIEQIIRRDGFGADGIPDLLFTNYKQIDEVGHRWTMNSPEMKASLRASDREFARIIQILDREVGKGQWVIALTADHGVTPNPALSGAFTIMSDALWQDIDATFGRDVVRSVRPTQVWINRARLKRNGYDLAQVVQFIARYTKGQSVVNPATLAPAERQERVFAAAFPSRLLERPLPCPVDH
jgi:hypothetical protein